MHSSRQIRNQGGLRQHLCGLAMAALALGACGEPTQPDASIEEVGMASECFEAGELRADLRGAVQASINWSAGDLSCEGMRRPGNAGARLRFSGPYMKDDKQQTLTMILGLTDLKSGQLGKEIPTNVTLVEEGSGRFFATPNGDSGNCWTDVSYHERSGAAEEFRIDGTLYCVSPLAEVGGTADIGFTELTFVGRLSWAAIE